MRTVQFLCSTLQQIYCAGVAVQGFEDLTCIKLVPVQYLCMLKQLH